MGGGYFDDFNRYGYEGSRNARRQHLPPRRETEEERAHRKAYEARKDRDQQGKSSYEREDCQYMERRDDQYERHREDDYPGRSKRDHTHSQSKRRHESDRGRDREGDESSKRLKTTDKSIPDPRPPTAPMIPPIPVELISDSPALQKETDIQAIINRPQYELPPGLARLSSRFPDLFLNGIHFDYDVEPFDEAGVTSKLDTAQEAMTSSIDAVRSEVKKVHNWRKLVHALSKVNKANYLNLMTMESDRGEWDKILKARNDEIDRNEARITDLETENKRLQDELASTTETHFTRESLLQKQVTDAHAAQRKAKSDLLIERQLTQSLVN